MLPCFFFFYEQFNSHIKQISQVDLFMVFVCLKEINMAITSTWMSEVTLGISILLVIRSINAI